MTELHSKIKNPWVVYFPFMVIFILIVITQYTAGFEGDEGRYVFFAQNLLQGFYSPKHELNLWNGPGYPIFILPFIALKLPLISIAIANAVLHYMSIVLLFKTILAYTQKHKTAFFYATCWAIYYLPYQELPFILTETLSSFLVVLFIFFLQKHFHQVDARKSGLIAGGVLGYLVLTKVVFGYVLLISFAAYMLLLFVRTWRKYNNTKLLKFRVVFFMSFVVVLPYLMYTYSITNRFPYFANSGGMSLYWMSTPFDNEYGDWNNETFTANTIVASTCNADLLKKNHQEDINYIMQFKGVERDDAYKKIALQNIRKHPLKYVKNCFANLSRLLFNFPSSYNYERDVTFLRVIPNAFIIVVLCLAFCIWLFNLRHTHTEINFIILFVFLYLAISILVSAYARQFYIIVPVLITFISIVLHKRVHITLYNRGEQKS